jgi:hypothetical protein
MRAVFVDYESFWSTTHSLTKINPIAYVMHPETEIISVAYAIDAGPVEVLFGEANIRDWAAKTDWSDTLLVAHNNEGFDAMISAWRFGIKPKMWGCTLAMARPRHAKTAGGSLKSLAEHYGLRAKGSLEATNTKGKHLKDFTADELGALREYNVIDTELCRSLFNLLAPLTPPAEAQIIDATIRMLVEPKFEVDVELLEATLADEQRRKKDTLTKIAGALGWQEGNPAPAEEFARAHLASAAKFSAFLTRNDVATPMKPSPTNPDKQTPALAKTDEAFIALTDHDNEVVAAAALARLGVKSTLLETRIAAFLQASEATGGYLPIPTKYYGADTTGRRSGWGYNPLNLPRVPRDKNGGVVFKPTNALRMCMRAPKGHKVVVADLSGIELRMNHFLWRVPSSMALFAADVANADLYKDFASKLYDVAVSDVTKAQRQIGKIAHLGLQYGSGASTFRAVAKGMGGVTLTLEESQNIVTRWRETYPEIVQGWRTSQRAVEAIAQGLEMPIDSWGLLHTSAEGVVTPQGIIRYPELRREVDDKGRTEWVYGERRHKARIYGSKSVENIVQHLSRFVITDAMLEMKRRVSLLPVMEVYDELVYVVPDSDAEDTLAALLEVMRTPPKWFPELRVWADGDTADTYGAAK